VSRIHSALRQPLTTPCLYLVSPARCTSRFVPSAKISALPTPNRTPYPSRCALPAARCLHLQRAMRCSSSVAPSSSSVPLYPISNASSPAYSGTSSSLRSGRFALRQPPFIRSFHLLATCYLYLRLEGMRMKSGLLSIVLLPGQRAVSSAEHGVQGVLCVVFGEVAYCGA
jgi:hypothetical protein